MGDTLLPCRGCPSDPSCRGSPPWLSSGCNGDAQPRRGLPFESLDGQPAHIVILLVLPKNKFQAHVRTLGGIAHLMSNANLRQALKNAPDSQTVLRLIEEEEDRVPWR